ncbi:hypothetical protein H4582DRAFT_1958494 [Lactarius indigo]|nr:hypothetical protein H4582DRAFT_1966799 [Lactarius indigo]KAI9437192.1 hypothetical protein H4582DRAFT_1958494 [Lactarius indigo]
MAISFSLSEIVALAIESFCYGIYFALFGSSVKVLLNKRKSISGAMLLLGLVGVFSVLITWHVITDAVRIVYAFKDSQLPIGGDLYFANVASALSLIKTALYLVITILFDAFILYRCWLIWDRSLVVIALPFLIFLADIGTGVAAVQGLSGIAKGDSVFIQRQEKITKSFFSSTVAVNGLCSLLIAYRVWVRQNPVRDSRKSFGLSKEAAILVESAALYFVTLICLISTYTRQSNAFNVFLDMASPIIGIAFTLIVLRMGNLATEATHISMQGMGEPIPEENRSVAGSMVKESLPQSEAHVGV